MLKYERPKFPDSVISHGGVTINVGYNKFKWVSFGASSSSSPNIHSKSTNSSTYRYSHGSFGYWFGLHSLMTYLVNHLHCMHKRNVWLFQRPESLAPTPPLIALWSSVSHFTLLSSVSFSENKGIKLWQHAMCFPDLNACDSVMLIGVHCDAVYAPGYKNSILHILLSAYTIPVFLKQINISIHAYNWSPCFSEYINSLFSLGMSIQK